MSELNGTPRFPPSSVARNVGHLAHDAVILAELQAELFKVDFETFLGRAAKPLAMLGLALITALGVVPIALAALAFALVHAGFPAWTAFLFATAAGLAVAAGMGWSGWLRFQRSYTAFLRSKAEFQNNVNWLKDALRGAKSSSSQTGGQ